MNRTGRSWYIAVIGLIILGIAGALVALCAPSVNAYDTDRHGRYYAYVVSIRTQNPDGTYCETYQPVRRDELTGKVRYAARWNSGKPLKVNRTYCITDSEDESGVPAGFRIINMSKNGRYLKFYTWPMHPMDVVGVDYPVTVYRKDFKTGRLRNLGTVMESSFYPPHP